MIEKCHCGAERCVLRLRDWTIGSPVVAVAMTVVVEQPGDQRLEDWRYDSACLATCHAL